MAKVLVIDDDGIVRDALAVFLSRAGHEVVTAADGANGLQVFKNSLPDLVILDRDLPVMSGSAVFDGIRKESRGVPVIILTGFDAPEEAEAYLRHGASAFLSKGGGLSRVLDEVDRLLGAPARPAPAGAAPLVLVADDDPQTRDILSRALRGAGYAAVEAEDGLRAVDLALAKKPDIILLDIAMPGLNGVEVLKSLLPKLPGAGFMMITGNDDESVARDCLALGAFDYVSKPVRLENMLSSVKARLLLQGK